jgi:hypothetical protein
LSCSHNGQINYAEALTHFSEYAEDHSWCEIEHRSCRIALPASPPSKGIRAQWTIALASTGIVTPVT